MQQWHLARSKHDKAGRRRGRPIPAKKLPASHSAHCTVALCSPTPEAPIIWAGRHHRQLAQPEKPACLPGGTLPGWRDGAAAATKQGMPRRGMNSWFVPGCCFRSTASCTGPTFGCPETPPLPPAPHSLFIHLQPATLALQEQIQLPLRQQAVAPEEDSDLGKVLCHHTGINNKFSSTQLDRDLPIRSRFRGGTTLPCLLRHFTYGWSSQKSLVLDSA